MKPTALLLVMLTFLFLLAGCQQATEPSATEESTAPAEVVDPTPGEIVANGVFMGRSGKPMANALVVFGKVIRDEAMKPQQIQCGPTAITVTTDAEGRFRVSNFTPDEYAVLYQPAGPAAGIPGVMIITPLFGNAESFMPLLENVEIGRDSDYEERTWGTGFVLLEGHTLFNKGRLMSIYNATVRTGSSGPYVELRQGQLVTAKLEDNAEIKIDAWSD